MSPRQVKAPNTSSTTQHGSSAAKAVFEMPPIPVLDTPRSRSIAYARPALLLSLLAWHFGRLVEDPVGTLTGALPLVALVQVIYVVLCLPVAGSRPGEAPRPPRPGERRKTEATGPNPLTTAIISLMLAAIATPFIHILFVLFGAPFLNYVAHTMLCAAHFALLGAMPIFYVRGLDKDAIRAIAGAMAPFDEPFGSLAGAALGAWLGAVPIPLDWDREWQKWPVTIVVGMYVGAMVGCVLSGSLLFGKRMAETEAASDTDEAASLMGESSQKGNMTS